MMNKSLQKQQISTSRTTQVVPQQGRQSWTGVDAVASHCLDTGVLGGKKSASLHHLASTNLSHLAWASRHECQHKRNIEAFLKINVEHQNSEWLISVEGKAEQRDREGWRGRKINSGTRLKPSDWWESNPGWEVHAQRKKLKTDNDSWSPACEWHRWELGKTTQLLVVFMKNIFTSHWGENTYGLNQKSGLCLHRNQKTEQQQGDKHRVFPHRPLWLPFLSTRTEMERKRREEVLKIKKK